MFSHRYVRRLQKRFAHRVELEASINKDSQNHSDNSSSASTSHLVEPPIASPFAENAPGDL